MHQFCDFFILWMASISQILRRDSSLKDRWKDYPAVHMSWNDATAKCLIHSSGETDSWTLSKLLFSYSHIFRCIAMYCDVLRPIPSSLALASLRPFASGRARDCPRRRAMKAMAALIAPSLRSRPAAVPIGRRSGRTLPEERRKSETPGVVKLLEV